MEIGKSYQVDTRRIIANAYDINQLNFTVDSLFIYLFSRELLLSVFVEFRSYDH